MRRITRIVLTFAFSICAFTAFAQQPNTEALPREPKEVFRDEVPLDVGGPAVDRCALREPMRPFQDAVRGGSLLPCCQQARSTGERNEFGGVTDEEI